MVKMTRSHFTFIAEHFKLHYQAALAKEHYSKAHMLKMMARDFGTSLEATNPKFNHIKFTRACGMEP